MMMDLIGKQHPLHPHIKSPIQEAEATKMVNLYQSRPHHLVMHCPKCSLAHKFMNLLERATEFDANKRATVWDLLKHPSLTKDIVFNYREMVDPNLFDRIQKENAILKKNQMSTNFEFDKLQRAHPDLTQQHRIDADRVLLLWEHQSEYTGSGGAHRPSLVLMPQHKKNRVEGSCP